MIVFLIDADNLNNAAWIDEACALLELEHGPVDTRRAYGSLENMKSLSGVLTKRAIRSFANQSLTVSSVACPSGCVMTPAGLAIATISSSS